jgi:hypothetical protein
MSSAQIPTENPREETGQLYTVESGRYSSSTVQEITLCTYLTPCVGPYACQSYQYLLGK